MQLPLLFLGFVLGVRHALESDHLAAVAALGTRARSRREHLALAVQWGSGHALVLLLAGGALLALGLTIPAALTRALEGVVALTLIVLGTGAVRRARQRQVHVHAHRHDGGPLHLHVHAHAGDAHGSHHPDDHRHVHPTRPWPLALLVGALHGLAGGGPLVVLSALQSASALGALGCLASFGLGSILAMAAFSVTVSWSVGLDAGRRRITPHLLEGAIGLATVAVGAWLAIDVSLLAD